MFRERATISGWELYQDVRNDRVHDIRDVGSLYEHGVNMILEKSKLTLGKVTFSALMKLERRQDG